MQMMSLGSFAFGLPTLAYQDLSRKLGWRYAENPRVGARPGDQFLGRDAETLDLKGVIIGPMGGKRESLETLEAMADTGQGFPAVLGSGLVLGTFKIMSIADDQSLFFEDGEPRKTDFAISLKRTDDAAQAGAR